MLPLPLFPPLFALFLVLVVLVVIVIIASGYRATRVHDALSNGVCA